MRASEERFRKVITDAPIPIMILAEDGEVLQISKVWTELTGYTHSDIPTLTEWTLKAYGQRIGDWRSVIDRLFDGRNMRNGIERTITTKSGESMVWSFWATPIGPLPDGRRLAMSTAMDITERKAAEQALLKSEMKAVMANQAKSEFLSSMSHELRTPLNAIFGFAQLLELNANEPLTETQKNCVDQIMKGGQHLLELIDDILDLAKIEAGQLELAVQPVNPAIVLDDCLSITQSMAGQRSISVVNGAADKDLPIIRADLTGFKQVMLNLLSNAVKYNRDAGTVTVDAEETSEGMLRISVNDTGPGIAKKDHARVFESFDRIGREAMNIEGTGIGLVISKRLMEAMGGFIGFESEAGKGSTFWIELPLAEDPRQKVLALDQPEDGPSLDQALGQGTQRRCVLYVEDNRLNVRLMQSIFAGIPNAELVVAADAEEGIKLANSEPPDLILMDVGLPGMDGIEAAGVLRNSKKTKDIPVIAISALAMNSDIERAGDANFFAYLTKPLDVSETLKVVRGALDEDA